MSGKFKNKYRIPSARLSTWDYSSNGSYFITICTAKRQHFFGEIVNKEIHLSEQGKIAHACWSEIPDHFQFVSLDEFVIMPNHIHGIIIIDKPEIIDHPVANDNNVETGHALSLHPRFRNPGKNTISSMVGSFKSAVTKKCNENNLASGWQSRFHDRIIRDEEGFHRIRNYILHNPANWELDTFFKNDS